MDANVKILCCRISWMREYQSKDERPFSYQRHIVEGNLPYEALNFRVNSDGLYRGYVPVGKDAIGKFGKISIERLGAAKADAQVNNVLVVFCAPREHGHGLGVVGFYRNASVLREPELSEDASRTNVTRIISNDAVLIAESERAFTIPSRDEGGFGQSSLWYGLNEGHPLRSDLLSYINDQNILPAKQRSVVEYRRRKMQERWEGRGVSRGFIYEKGFRCEACDYTIEVKDEPIWGSGFELHHLSPWSSMETQERRELTADDFAVLCSTCHRAIHRTKFVNDIHEFRTRVLANRGR